MRGFFVPPTRGRLIRSGKMQKSVMPATASPAPRSKSVSVSDGTSETTRDGGVAKSNVRPRMSFIARDSVYGRPRVAQTLLSVPVRLGTTEKIIRQCAYRVLKITRCTLPKHRQDRKSVV